MPHIHPNARTTPAVRAEIARSTEPSGTVARRYGISAETVRKWRKRGAADCLDHSARPHRLPWKATDEERAVVCALRRATNFALDDRGETAGLRRTFVVAHFLPHLNRDSIWRILRAEGLNRRRPAVSAKPARGQGTFPAQTLCVSPGLRPRLLGVSACGKRLSTSTSSTCPSCKQPMASSANAFSTSPSTGAHAPSTWPSRRNAQRLRLRTTKPRKAPSPFSGKPQQRFPSASPMC